MSVHFDSFSDTEIDIQAVPEFFTVAKKSDKEILEWLNNNFDSTMRAGISRFETYKSNKEMFKGIQSKPTEHREYNYGNQKHTREIRNPRIVVNFIQEMLQSKVAKWNKSKPAVALIPNNDSAKDRNGVKACEMLLRNNWMEQDIDSVLIKGDTVALLYGESYTMVDWDASKGPIHKKYKEAKEKGEKIPKLDKEGNPIKGKYIEDEIHIGDVSYTVRTPENLLLRYDVSSFEEVDHYTILDWRHIDKVKEDYKDKLIKEEEGIDYENDVWRKKRGEKNILVKCFYHIPTKYLPKGAMIKFTRTDILEKGDFPYDDGQLGFSRRTDIDIVDELYARSFIGNIKQLQRHYNNISSGIARNHALASAPKWMMPKGAASIESLNNDFTIVEFKGAVPPKLVQANPTGQEMLIYQDKLDNQIQRQAKVGSMTFGEPPRGVDAAVAMQFISEQENQRDNTDITKRNLHIIKLAKLALNRMKQFYDESDDRMIHILGEDNSYLVKSFKSLNFDGVYDVRIMNSSALPESKGARVQTIISLNQATQTDPNGPIFKTPEIIRMMDLANDEAFKDKASVSEKSAEWILQSIIMGEQTPDPELTDDLLFDYHFFMRALRERTFKDPSVMPSDIKAKIQERLMIIEGLMWEMSKRNPLFAQKLAMVDTFPCFFTVPEEATVEGIQGTIQGNQAGQMMEIMQNAPDEVMMGAVNNQQGAQ